MQVILLVCDDLRLEFNGKTILVGVYNGDIIIPFSPFAAGQLYFIFNFECDVSEIPRNLTFEITLPGQKPLQWPCPIPQDVKIPNERKKAYVRQPCPIFGPVLNEGRIEAKVIHDMGEIEVAAPWIVQMPAPQIAQESDSQTHDKQ